jgi:hypothetical protein
VAQFVRRFSSLIITRVLNERGYLGDKNQTRKPLQRQMELIYSTEILLFFNIIPEHIDAFVPFWHEFKNSFAAEIGILHSQPFTTPFPLLHYCGIGNLPSVSSEAQTNGSTIGL